MICLHRLKGEEFWVNHRLIETVESNPDTVITLSNDHRYIVRESPQEISRMIQDFEREFFSLRKQEMTEK